MLVAMPARTIPVTLRRRSRGRARCRRGRPVALGDHDVVVAQPHLGGGAAVVRHGPRIARALSRACLYEHLPHHEQRRPWWLRRACRGPKRVRQSCAPINDLFRGVRSGQGGDAVLEVDQPRAVVASELSAFVFLLADNECGGRADPGCPGDRRGSEELSREVSSRRV